MNKFKQEQRDVFGELKLTEERKKEVLQAVEKKRNSWVPAGVVAVLSVLCLFFIMNGFRSDEGYSQAGAIAAYKQFLQEEQSNMQVDIRHVELPFERKNDAIIVSVYDQGDSEVYYFQYMTFKDKKWSFGLSGVIGQKPSKTELGYSSWTYYDYHEKNGDVIFAGVLKDDADKMVVGEKEVKTFTIDWEKIWIALAPSSGTPVYTVKDGVKKRTEQYRRTGFTSEPPIISELVGDNYAISYKKDTMHVYGEEYTQFDIVIDPDYYATTPFNTTDVVLIEGKEGPEVVRILATYDMGSHGVSVKKEESSIIINDIGILEPDGWARAKGQPDYKNNSIIDYGEMKEGEIFVHPDNWLSDGTQGYIPKNQVIGKVLGYSMTDIETTWSPEELSLYDKVKQKGFVAAANADPKEIARIQLYALLIKDYKTAHTLTSGISYEQMEKYFKETKNRNLDHFIRYYAFMLEKAEFNKTREKLIVKNPYKEEIFEWDMVRDEGWKVKFATAVY